MALLTADDIRNKLFKTTRFKEGYDVDEVDDFLEETILTVEGLEKNADSKMSSLDKVSLEKEVKDQLFALRNDKETLLAQNKSLKDKIEEKEKQTDELQEKLKKIPVSTVDEDQVKKLLSLVNDLKKKVTDLSAENESTQKAKDEAQAKLDYLLKEHEQLVANQKEFDAKNVKESNVIQQLRDQVNDYERKLKQQSYELSEAKTLEENLKAHDLSQQRVDKLESDLELAKRTVSEDEATIENMKREIDAYKDKAKAMDESVKKTSSELDLRKKALKTANVKLKKTEELVAQQNDHISNLQEQLREIEASSETGSFELIKSAGDQSPAGALSMISMAKELYDKYVSQGKELKDKNIAEAKAESENIVKEAKALADSTYANLAKDRASIEKRIEQLRVFETEYKDKMHSFLESVLNQLNTVTKN
jgi:DivIVA domain-containing protein